MPVDAQAGIDAPDFGQRGGSIRYLTGGNTVQWLVDKGYPELLP